MKKIEYINIEEIPHIYSAGGIVTNYEGKLLLILKNSFWDLPKGGIEVNSSALATAKREIEEETGLSRKYLKYKAPLIPSKHIKDEFGTKKLKITKWFIFECKKKYVTFSPQGEEGITKCKWFSKEEIYKAIPLFKSRIYYILDFFFKVRKKITIK